MYKAKVIKPNLSHLQPAIMRVAINRALDEVAQKAKQDFEQTVETWEEKPDFVIEGDNLEGRSVYTTDRIYGFVNNGTNVRYATMTPDFRAKTTPKVIGSRSGSGGVHYINKRVPRPGIEARRFDEIIAKKWEAEYPTILQKAVYESSKFS